MNYAIAYSRLMDRARTRVLGGYVERHHVLPRCMGGTEARSNIVDLTAREHYIAHQLLVKMHPQVRGLATAAVRMARQCVGGRAYGWLRERHAADIRASMLGRIFTPEWKEKISRAMSVVKRGNTNRLGTTHSAASKKKIGSASRGRVLSAEHRQKISAALKGKTKSEDMRQKLSAAMKGNKRALGHRHSEQSKRLMSEMRTRGAGD